MSSYESSAIKKDRCDDVHFSVSYSTDESPPGEPRFAGLRFQITYVHILTYEHVSTWNAHITTYPVNRAVELCDVCHVPEKTGAGTMKVLLNQLAAKGVSQYDIVSGTSDGGGEATGQGGLHKIMETFNPSYVPRRCFLHLSWRVADAGIREMVHSSHTQINTYLRDGVTWSRLISIACQPVNRGGLGLLTNGSIEYRDFTAERPPKVLEDRPETDYEFLKWLIPRQKLLAKLVPHDVAARNLKMKPATVSAESLSNRTHCALRCVDAVLIHKALYLYYKFKLQKRVVSSGRSFEDTIEYACNTIMDLRLDDSALKTFDTSLDELETIAGLPAKDRHEFLWPEIALHFAGIDDDEHERDAFNAAMLAEHERVSTKMTAHLKLTADNICRSHWQSAAMLNTDPMVAQAGANKWRDYLVRLRPTSASPYDSVWLQSDAMMNELGLFCDRASPCLLWHDDGKYKTCFQFLADRFLGQEDSVMDCESVHARWKILCQRKRALGMPMLNAYLKLKYYLDRNSQFPGGELLSEHINRERDAFRA